MRIRAFASGGELGHVDVEPTALAMMNLGVILAHGDLQ
jgi:hypothetical protein